MTVEKRTGPNFKSGFTWHVSIPFTRVKENVPCYELVWNDEGKVESTGRFGLLTWSEAEKTQQQSEDFMVPDLGDDDDRLCTEAEYKARFAAINNGDYDGGLPERTDSEAPF